MSEEDALLRAICEHPDEDTPRLMFADWLDEQGGDVNTAWAKGIRAQIWMARGATDAELALQARVFESSDEDNILERRLGLPQGSVDRWERGFPARITLDFTILRNLWPQLALRIPVRQLYISQTTEADTAEFVTWPGLSRLNELEICVAWQPLPRPDVVSILAQCEALSGLKSLKVWDADVNDTNTLHLLDSPHMANLEVLVLGVDREDQSPLSPEVGQRLNTRFGKVLFDNIPF